MCIIVVSWIDKSKNQQSLSSEDSDNVLDHW